MPPRRRALLAAVAAGATGPVGGCLSVGGDEPECTSDRLDVGRVDGVGADTWPMRGYDPANTGANPGARLPDLDDASVAWSAPPGDSPAGHLLVAGGRVYLRTDGQFVALGADDGAELWALGTEEAPGVYGYALAGGTAYLGRYSPRNGGHLLAVDAVTGDEAWRASTKKLPDSVAVTDREVVVGTVGPAGSSAGWIHSFDPADGEERWGTDLNEDVDTRPVVTEDLVLAGTDGREFVALDRSTGGQCWSVDLEVDPWYGATSGGRVYVGTTIPGETWRRLEVRDGTDGSLRWRTDALVEDPTRHVDRIAVADGTALLSNDEGVYALAGDGSTDWFWERPGPGDQPSTRTLLVAGGTVVTDAPGSLRAVDLESGEETGSLAIDGTVAGLAAADGSLYAAVTGGEGPRILRIR